MQEITMGVVDVVIVIYLLLVIFKWDWLKEKISSPRGKKYRVFEWILYNWGDNVARIYLCVLCAGVLICSVLAFIQG